MALYKYVDGKREEMTPQEEAAFLAQQSIDKTNAAQQEARRDAIEALGWDREVQFQVALAIVNAVNSVNIFPAEQRQALIDYIALYEAIPNPPGGSV